jgi:hypothetical protein
MADSIPRCMSAALIQKLHALAERRCAHLKELRQSGRWTRYYSREELVARTSDADDMLRHWRKMLDGDHAADRVPQASPEPTMEMPVRPSALAIFASRRFAVGGH